MPLKITLCITDMSAAYHIGGDAIRSAIQFDMPPEIEQEIRKQQEFAHVQLSLVITEVFNG